MSRRLVWVGLLCGLLVLPVAQVFAQDGVKLQYQFKAGEELRYKLIMDMTMAMKMDMPGMEDAGEMPEMAMQMVAVMKQKTKKVLSNGDAEIVLTYESMKMTADGKTENAPVDKEPPVTMVVTKSGAVKSVKGLDKQDNPMGQFMNPEGFTWFAVLPEEPVKADDTWTQEIPSPVGEGRIGISGKVLSTNTKIGDYKAAKLDLDMTGDLSFSAPVPGAGDEAGGTMDSKANLEGKQTVYFSADKGRIVRTDGTAAVDMTMDFAGPDGESGSMMMNIAMKYQMFVLPAK